MSWVQIPPEVAHITSALGFVLVFLASKVYMYNVHVPIQNFTFLCTEADGSTSCRGRGAGGRVEDAQAAERPAKEATGAAETGAASHPASH